MSVPEAESKVCLKCGFRNSVQKKYCDHCGESLASASSQAAPAPSPSAEAGEIPPTIVRRIAPQEGIPPAGAAQGFRLPPAGRAARTPAPAPSLRDAAQPTRDETSMTALRKKNNRHNLTLVLVLVLAVAASAGWHRWSAYQKPENLAERYLDALRRPDFQGAYATLSKQAKDNCTLEEFSTLRDKTPWSWSDIKVLRSENEAVLIQYRLQLQGKPASLDYLFFVREGRRWARPYNRTLLQRTEAAFDRGDPDMALLLSQAAVGVNPRDPMARGYLCEALYHRKAAVETELECALALKLSQAYPSKLSLKSLYHLHAILGDTYKNALKKFPQALAVYDTLLAFPDLPAADRCDLLLVRADTHDELSRLGEAAADLTAASALCTKPADRDYIAQKEAEFRGRR